MATKNLLVRAGADFSGMRKEMTKANQSMKSFKSGMGSSLKKLAGVFAAAFAVKKIVDFGKASYDAANQVAISEAKLTTIMRQRMGATDEMIKSVLSLADAQEKIGVVDAGAQIAGAQELATYLEQASSIKSLIPVMNDLVAQQYGLNASSEQVTGMATMLGKVMDGQVGALSRYGFTFSEAEAKILKFGKEEERVALLTRIVHDSLGDMNAELGKTPQGQMKQLAFTMTRVKEELGRGIMPIMQKLLPYIQAMANAFLRAAQYATAFINAIFGKTQAQTKATSQLAGAAGDLADAYDDAGKAAKGSVAGFDEVNSLADSASAGPTTDISGLLADTGTAGSPLDTIGESMSNVSEKAREMAARVRESFGQMSVFIRDNSDAIVAALAGITAGFSAMWLAANGGAIASGALKSLRGLVALASPIGLIAAAIAAVTAAGVMLWKNWDDLDTKWKVFGSALLGSVGIIVAVGKNFETIWQNVFVPFGNFLAITFTRAFGLVELAASALESVLKPIGSVLIDYLAIAFSTVAAIAKSFWKNVLIPLGSFFVDVFGPAVEAMSAVFGFLWNQVLEPFGKFLADVLKVAFTNLTNTIVHLWDTVLKPLATYMGGVFMAVFESVFKSIGDVIDGLKRAFIGLMSFITGVFTGDWQRAWEGIKDIFGGIWDAMSAILKSSLNVMISLVNKFIGYWNNIKLTVPDVDLGPFGSFKGFTIGLPNIPPITPLAKGGITNGPMLALVGDNVGGQEVVSPLDDLLGMITSAVTTAMMTMSQMQGGQNRPDIVLMMDTKEVARVVGPALDDEKQRTGTRLIIQPT